MSLKRILPLIVVFALQLPLHVMAQRSSDVHLSGHVINKSSREYMPSVNLSIKGTTRGTSTDATGHYFLKNLPSIKCTLVVSAVGFKTIERQLDLTDAQNLSLDFEMEEDPAMLDAVVVSANRNETVLKEAPTIVNLINPAVFKNTNSVCLKQGLDFLPGLRTEVNCANCGLPQVRINGLDGTYSQILIDSRPIFSALQSVYGIEQIPANMIERVEVVRGGGSALFGTNAVGGTINIITKEPDENSMNVTNTTTFIGGKTPDVTTAVNATIVSDDDKSGVALFASSRQRDPYSATGDGYSEITQLKDQSLGLKGFYEASTYSKLTVEYHNQHDFLRGGNDFDLPVQRADIAEEAEYYINAGGVNYDVISEDSRSHINLYTSAQLINRTNYAGAQQDTNGFGKTDGKTLVSGIQWTNALDEVLFMPANLTLGAEYTIDDLHDNIVGYSRTTDQNISIKSAFVQNEWRNNKLSLLLGCRVDKHALIEDVIASPRTSVRYSVTDNVQVRASFSTGFRAPQVYDEDLHGNAIAGTISMVENNPDLKPEKSQSYSGSVEISKSFGCLQTAWLLEGFYTNLDRVFVLNAVGINEEGIFILERDNAPGAVVKGINLEGKLFPSSKLQLQFGATFQSSRYKEALQWSDDETIVPQKRMFRSPNSYGYMTFVYQATNACNISLSGVYTGSMLVQHFAGYIANDEQHETPEFYVLNAKVSYDIPIGSNTKVQLNAGVQNIFDSYQDDFDRGAFRDSKYIYGPSLPRSLTIGLAIQG